MADLVLQEDRFRATTGISNLHRLAQREIEDIARDAAQVASTNMKVRMPHATFKSAEGVHTIGPIPRTGPFGHPELDYIAETDDTPGQSAVRYFARGTGLWGRLHAKYGARTAKALLFKRTDGGNFTSKVRGQPPQTNWIRDSRVATNNYVRLRVLAFGSSIAAKTKLF